MEENIFTYTPFTYPDTGTPYTGWKPESPDLFSLRSMNGRYMYSFRNSVHMNPNHPDSKEEIRRCEREREYGEQLRRECEQWEMYEGEPGVSSYTYSHDPEVEEQLREERRREAMRARVERDEEMLARGEDLNDNDDYGDELEGGVYFEGKEMGGDGVRFECGGGAGEYGYEGYKEGKEAEVQEEYEGEEGYEGYEMGEEYEGYEEYEGEFERAEGYEVNEVYGIEEEHEGNDGDEIEEELAKKDSTYSITSTQQSQAEYESARQVPDSDIEDLLLMSDIEQPEGAAESITPTPNKESDTDENDIFYSISDEGQAPSSGDSTSPQEDTPTVGTPRGSPSPIDTFVPYFKAKLNHPSGRYTEEDLCGELRGLVMESFCGWVEVVRQTVPGAASTETLNCQEQCRHLGFWNKEFGSSECEVCHVWMPIFTLSCPGCGLKACVRCKFQYAK
jgi:hypothetical protein